MRSGAIGVLRSGASVSALLTLVLVGCGGGGEEPAGLNATESNDDGGTQESTTGPSATGSTDDATDAKPTGDTGAATEDAGDGGSSPEPAGGQVHEFSDIGVTVVEPDKVPGDLAFALERYVDFIYEWRWSLQEVEVSEKLKVLASRDMISRLEGSIDYQTENGIHYGGELTMTLEYERRNEHMVMFSGCANASDYAWIDNEGEHLIRGENGNETMVVNTTVTNNGGLWLVNEVIEENEPC